MKFKITDVFSRRYWILDAKDEIDAIKKIDYFSYKDNSFRTKYKWKRLTKEEILK